MDINKTKEYTVSEIFSVSFSLYKKQFVPLFIIALTMYVAVDVISYLLNISVSGSAYAIFPLFFSWFSYNAYKKGQNGTKLSVSNVMATEDKTVVSSLFFTYAVYTLLLVLLFLLFIIPGIYFAVYWTFVLFVVLDKHLSYKKALDFSKEIVKGRWWKVFFVALLSYLITILFLIPVLFLPEGLFADIIASIIASVCALYAVHVSLVMYLNLEVVKSKNVANVTKQELKE